MSSTSRRLTHDEIKELVTSVVSDISSLVDQISAADLPKPTPCDEYNVLGLADHIGMVLRRMVIIGNGGDWKSVSEGPLANHSVESASDLAWVDDFKALGSEVTSAWREVSLDESRDFPWGETPGHLALFIYAGELITHGWDLSVSIDGDFAANSHEHDERLLPVLKVTKGLPAEARADIPGQPFGEVVETTDTATTVEQIAAWFGHDVKAWPR